MVETYEFTNQKISTLFSSPKLTAGKEMNCMGIQRFRLWL